ncbi:MAG: multicopper oxidase domain-containing protein [Syntrophobacteraceae bacterium]
MRRLIKHLNIPIFLMFFGAGLLVAGSASASTLYPQTAFDAKTAYLNNTGPVFPLFTSGATTLPIFGPGYNRTLPRVDAAAHPYLTVKMKEIDQQVLPASGFGKTRVWAYEISDSFTGHVLGPALWPSVTIEAQRNVPTVATYQNMLPSFGQPIAAHKSGTGLVEGLLSVDPTIHWADPLHTTIRFPSMKQVQNPCMTDPLNPVIPPGCDSPFIGPIPAVPHLHGAEDPSYYDGGPDAWFTPASASHNGPGFSTFNALYGGLKGTGYTKGILGSHQYSAWLAKKSFAKPTPGRATYIYDNAQEPGTLWFHDHALGITRTNVYSGLEAFYFLRDPDHEPYNLPKGGHEIEMVFQDRQFDQNGQFVFPDGSTSGTAACGAGGDFDECLNGPPPNPALHPFWIPEFIGDVAVVNGAPWPVLKVEPRRYLFRLLDGANARMWDLTFGDTAKNETLPPVYVIGNDANYLNTPVKVSKVFIAPGQRTYVIVDFSGLAGKKVTLTNDAPVPFPSGLSPVPYAGPCVGGTCPADQPQMHYVMQFKVSIPLKSRDTSCKPAAGGCKRPAQTVSLASVTNNGLVVNKKRQLVLKEFEGVGQFGGLGGPVEVLVENTRWDGLLSPSIAKDFPTDGMSELPQEGSIEEWDIINLTEDAHPMHTHLTQFQILNRQNFDTDGTMGSGIPGGYIGFSSATKYIPGAWAAAFFPSGTTFNASGQPSHPAKCSGMTYYNQPSDPLAFNPCPEYGPPLDYLKPNQDGAVGGNPAIRKYLIGSPMPAPSSEAGWRETAIAYPGQVLRLLVRWTPSHVPQRPGQSYAGRNLYGFDPTAGPGYVWHCHILDHEDNEMMRPYRVSD